MSLYLVLKGRQEGIFTSWAECHAMLNKYPGALYFKVKTVEEAKQKMEDYARLTTASSHIASQCNGQQVKNKGKQVISVEKSSTPSGKFGAEVTIAFFPMNSSAYIIELCQSSPWPLPVYGFCFFKKIEGGAKRKRMSYLVMNQHLPLGDTALAFGLKPLRSSVDNQRRGHFLNPVLEFPALVIIPVWHSSMTNFVKKVFLTGAG
ncbi:hypothetical protein AXF42_Ash018601 [Apostasia shenzhenica]|uniref:Ribonuclease H1 N-terminal domain-containing protein n=1 Tax=Apostasia shenzhenica TaxID=1088818 RepID=A0A2I0B1E9_9ASPA|nr:hypothetical protein AXF42_Ash018601 [Apostasia shenzhenica]